MTKKGTSKKYIDIVQNIYVEVKMNVRTCEGATKEVFNHNWPSLRLGPKSISFFSGLRWDNSIDIKTTLVHIDC